MPGLLFLFFEDPDDGLMFEVPHVTSAAKEALDARGVAGVLVVQHLHRNLAGFLFVIRAPDRGESTLAQWVEENEAAIRETISGLEPDPITKPPAQLEDLFLHL